ncbi:hypothetical protein LSCM1_04276 [Leishmania martiniquensis]|uniref:Uncharacterized protein n=1 Tax=Leishmania martiniquensis TaxID=1580590 RepID=A0A836HF02_9TRYP|nr:hypothetical protein LSCM1_04276 [Leishmania martiniquensis]
MSDSDDDVMIIDSSLPSTSASSGASDPCGIHREPPESNDDFGDVAGHDAPRAAASPTSSAGIANFPALPQAATAVEELCRHMEGRLKGLPPLRVQANTQTQECGGADTAASLYHCLRKMEAAVGLHAPSLASAAPPTAQSIVRQFVDSWRGAAGRWKRPRPDDSMREGAEKEGMKHIKRESDSEADIWQCFRGASSTHPRDTPAWAVDLEAALERCLGLIESPNYAIAVRKQEEKSALRAALARVSAAEALRAPLQARPAPRAAAPPSSVPAAPSHAALLQEAELICARERTDTLLPMYSELHALRRMRAEREQQAAHTVEEQLEWEQRRLADMLAECDAQLEMLDSNFLDACKSPLAPIETLQQRMDSLTAFRRQLEAHAAAVLPLASKDVATLPKRAWPTTESARRPPRPMGLAGDALSQCMGEERRAWEVRVAALQAQIEEQKKCNAQLHASYVHANAQLHASLDRDNYVSREVLNAAKAQHRADMEVLVGQLGWNLVNSTTDVLSLRHPGTGATLHINHTYSTINGEACESVAKTLAAYILTHAAPPVNTEAPVAAASVAAGEGCTGSSTLPPSPPLQVAHQDSGAASFARAVPPEASRAAGETLSPVAGDAVAQAAPASQSASAPDESASAPSSRRSSLPAKVDTNVAGVPPIHSEPASRSEELEEVVQQSPLSAEAAAEPAREDEGGEDNVKEACGVATASSDDTLDGGGRGDDAEACGKEGGSTLAEEEDGDGGRADAAEDLAGYSNVATEEDSGDASTSNTPSAPSSACSKGNDALQTPVQAASYESFFSPSQLWQSEDE